MSICLTYHQKHSEVISSLLTQKTPTIHCFSQRQSGDMRVISTRSQALSNAHIKLPLYLPEQIHSNKIHVCKKNSQEKSVQADGIILPRDVSQIGSIGVLTGDCVPVLFADRKGRYIAAAHAGWKGTLKNICANMIDSLVRLGVDRQDIVVAVGPFIGVCCYRVPADRATKFLLKCRNDSSVVIQFQNNWYIDIGKMNVLQLQDAGVKRENIDTGIFCTSCQSDLFFSNRKDNGNLSGEMIAAISFI